MTEYTSSPLAYFITFTTYGTWLHGDARGSVDPDHRVYGTPFVAPDPQRVEQTSGRRRHTSVLLNPARRKIVEEAIRDVCNHRDWTRHAMNVRRNHVHVVVSAEESPERVMNTLKSWLTRRMVEAGALPAKTKAWTRHGSTRYLWNAEQVANACRYVVEGQGQDLTRT